MNSASQVNLNEIVEEVSSELERSFSDNVKLRFNFAVNIPAIQADPGDIRLVVTNLLTNAYEALEHEDGVIVCTTGSFVCDQSYLQASLLREKAAEGPYVFLEVTDTGSGMEEEVRRRILEPFFSTKPTGSGFGMAGIIEVVRNVRGALRVNSAPGIGSTFTVLFPALPRPAMDSDPEIPIDWQGEGTILLVDDAKTCLAVGGRILEQRGFKVLKAENGCEAVDLLKLDPGAISCVVLDLVMPQMDGAEAMRLMRAIRPDLPIILSSGYSEQDLAGRFTGVHAFVQKPYRASVLLEKVREATERQHQHHA